MSSLLTDNIIVRQCQRIFRHFDTIPPNIAIEQYRFYIISNIGYTVGWMIHAAWFVLFGCMGLYTIMLWQLASIACHITAIALNRRGHHLAAMTTGMLEVIGHQMLAVHLLGWDAGFQYIIAAITVFPFLKHDGSLIVKTLLVLCCMASYLFLEVLYKNATPVYQLTDIARHWFNYSNITLCFAFIATWGFFLTIAIQRTEEVLNRKKAELFAAEKAAEQSEFQRQLQVNERDMEIYRLKNVELRNSHQEIALRNQQIEEEKKRSETLLLNILPEETANELLESGTATTHQYQMVTVMFLDFVNFTTIAETMGAEELVKQIDNYFRAFDDITLRYGVEKIKTIGDAYMCAGGLPTPNATNPYDVVRAALQILQFVANYPGGLFQVRIGISTGPVIAGVVGKHKFQYDIWGDTVNTAARLEQHSLPGQINISHNTYVLIQKDFNCEPRGKVAAKNKGELEMYFVLGEKSPT